MARTTCVHFFFFFNDTATTEIYTLSLHDALPISLLSRADGAGPDVLRPRGAGPDGTRRHPGGRERKSTRLHSSHSQTSYAVFCLKKKQEASRTTPATHPPSCPPGSTSRPHTCTTH